VGTAEWDYPDWRGIVYPNKKKTKSFDELGYQQRDAADIEDVQRFGQTGRGPHLHDFWRDPFV